MSLFIFFYLLLIKGASVTTVKVEASLTNIPLAHVCAEGPCAEAESGLSWNYTGVNAGAHVGEATVGPLAIRAGVKVGMGVRNGIPELDIGPVTIPCSLL